MMTRKSIDTVLLSVAADKLSQREWDWITRMKPIAPPAAMVASAILDHRGDTTALSRLPPAACAISKSNPSPKCWPAAPASAA
ncbi:hypothetical protein LU631_09515 [Erwinia tracheiphila]|uniref:Uncharacterized protein n=1 Tax=Erwinia tracheiphila TaxID=65700 RepID=A0A345CNX9_9GAMM|nr:hypothetical protein [Erwinia tracheiphila]AXF75143.1 hypothetical protein AV903_01865 [Erwinia tracheiphila]AXF75146.1 hypothetical protein AV903_01885 [Erwinia tracheiphila]UIA82307.1 hypothetical protein LU604_17305 [Erwinia tracheiphila]UIA82310.1 hypothetical protein LU604_17325 [Erwinia tracheiphila]UIA89415.1 hypothetical protein LU631_09485 [Erwinia tracheiphila]